MQGFRKYAPVVCLSFVVWMLEFFGSGSQSRVSTPPGIAAQSRLSTPPGAPAPSPEPRREESRVSIPPG